MYNQNTKQKFLDDTPKMKTKYEIILNTTESYEADNNLDIGEMTKDQIIEMIKQLGYTQYSSVEDTVNAIKAYLVWYSANVKEVGLNTISFTWRDIDLSDTFRNIMIPNEEDIIYSFSSMKPENGNLIMPVLLLAFHGFTSKEICDMKDDDVSCAGNKVFITLHGKTHIIVSQTTSDVISKYKSFHGGIVNNKTESYATMRHSDIPFLYRIVRTDSDRHYEDYASIQLGLKTLTARRRLTHDKYRDRFDMQTCRVSGQCVRMLKYKSKHGNFPNRNDTAIMCNRTNLRNLEYEQIVRTAEAFAKAFNM